MGIRKYKPTTPGRRGSSVADFVEITRSTPEKSLVRPLSKSGGRNSSGRITTRHKGGGHKRAYRLIDFRRHDKDGVAGPSADIKPGNNLQLRHIPTGTVVHAVELRPGGGAKIARSAGTSVQLVAKEGKYAQLRMPSGEIRNVEAACRATIGEVGNAEQSNINWGGEGKTSGGRHPVSPWGKPEGRTRRPNKSSDRLIVRRRRTGKKR